MAVPVLAGLVTVIVFAMLGFTRGRGVSNAKEHQQEQDDHHHSGSGIYQQEVRIHHFGKVTLSGYRKRAGASMFPTSDAARIRVDGDRSSVPAHSRAFESIQIVTGPSFTRATCISAPKTPRSTGRPVSAASAAQKPS